MPFLHLQLQTMYFHRHRLTLRTVLCSIHQKKIITM
jgi:hypothetical protein